MAKDSKMGSAINQHKKMAMGQMPAMKKGGKVPCMKKGGKTPKKK